jgi:hypothetical protein
MRMCEERNYVQQNPTVGANLVFTPLTTQKEPNRTWEETLQVFLQDDLSWIVHRHNLVAKHPLINIRLSEVENFSSVDCGSCWRRLLYALSPAGATWVVEVHHAEGQVAGYRALWAPMLAGSWLKTTFTAVSQALPDPSETLCKVTDTFMLVVVYH